MNLQPAPLPSENRKVRKQPPENLLLRQDELMFVIHGFEGPSLLCHTFPVPVTAAGIGGVLFYETVERHATKLLEAIVGRPVTVTIETSSAEVIAQFHALFRVESCPVVDSHSSTLMNIPATIEWGSPLALVAQTEQWVKHDALPPEPGHYFVRLEPGEYRSVLVKDGTAWVLFPSCLPTETAFCGVEWLRDLTKWDTAE